MSRWAKSEAKKRRRAKKRARKAAQRAQYEAWRLAGQNTKSKRVKLRAKRARAIRNQRHGAGPCGNIGCKRCNPILENLVTPAHRHMTVQ
ncbi:MAG: hypothetical protein JNL21_35015 [Myxococcales bacterium]|nr:hypothetical protein [Myxococcales bacterium]